MSLFKSAILLALVSLVISAIHPECPPHEIYVECANCPDMTCEGIRYTPPPMNAKIRKSPCQDTDKCRYKQRCYCVTNYARNDIGICVPEKECF
ncbi:hypothetical protein Ddc_14636 [Ditylenchus destructor]|nr:hypothetical protein Ddc_14636 [Ditylenchus destructor]